MNKKTTTFFIATLLFILPNVSIADSACSSTGYTISSINGVLTDNQGAVRNERWLAYFVGKSYKGENIDYQYLFNPSHLGGGSDLMDSAVQKIFESETVADYDLIEMMKIASRNVKTQKLLLVAHSQGNFYANNFYNIVAEQAGGVPASSIGVYSVATPSSLVAGNGRWITSDTDNVIVGKVQNLFHKKIMSPNTHISQSLVGNEPFGGHDFVDVYLQYRSNKIVADVQSSLSKLSSNATQNINSACLSQPVVFLEHKINGGVYAVADPVFKFISKAFWVVGNSIADLGSWVHRGFIGLFYGGSGSGDNAASVILATHKLPQDPPTDPSIVIVHDQTPTSPDQSGRSSNNSTVSFATTTVGINIATTTATSTVEKTRVAAYGSNGGGGGGASPQPSSQSSGDSTENSVATTTPPAIAELPANGIIFATSTALTYTNNPITITGNYHNDGAFNVVDIKIENPALGIATSSTISAEATTTGATLSFDRKIDIQNSGTWEYRVRLEDSNNASSTPWSIPGIFTTDFATTTATSTDEVATTTSKMVFEQPDLNSLSYSDLNLNGLPDSSEEYVIASTTMSLPAGEYLFHNLTISTNTYITAEGSPDSPSEFKGVKIFADNLTLEPRSYLTADGQGYTFGPGAWLNSEERIGASYGGVGTGNTHTSVYGSAMKPVDLGSGSGYYRGGGAIQLVVTGTLSNDGRISAEGGPFYRSSGGSIYITTSNFVGTGALSADGRGSDWPTQTGGSGGRIAVYYGQSSFSGKATSGGGLYCYSGCSAVGEAGTVVFVDVINNDLYPGSSFLFQKNDEPFKFHNIRFAQGSVAGTENGVGIIADKIFVQNNSSFSITENTSVKARELFVMQSSLVSLVDSPNVDVSSILIGRSSILRLFGDKATKLNTLTLNDGGTLEGEKMKTLSLVVSDLIISPRSLVLADIAGFDSKSGPGAPSAYYAGASYGGVGYNNSATSTYGSFRQPTDFGSGGGASNTRGGGAIRIVSTGTLINNGTISATGDSSSSGGSVYVNANMLEGSGVFSAKGGNIAGGGYYSGPGGGGRVAVYYNNSAFTGETIASGGCGSYDGFSRVCAEDGTVVYEKNGDTPLVELSSAKAITSFTLSVATSTISGIIDETIHTINLSVPFGTDVHSLIPTITLSPLATSSPSSLSPQDFSNPVTYTVTAEDGSTQSYVVTVVIDQAPVVLPAISTYSFNGVAGNITTDFASSTPPIELALTANKNVDWVSVTIENQSDSTIYKRFLSGTGCVDGTATCAKTWDGTLSGDGYAPDGTYQIKAHIKDTEGNEFNDYLLPYVIVIKRE